MLLINVCRKLGSGCLSFKLILVSAASVLYTDNSFSADYFNLDSVENRGSIKDNIDLFALNYSGGQIEGVYLTSVYLNGDFVAEEDIVFKLKDQRLLPELTKKVLVLWGVNPNATPEFMPLKDEEALDNLVVYLPQSNINYDFTKQRLDISVPQQYMKKVARRSVNPEEWDDGINAAFINYAFSGSQSWRNSGNYSSHYLGLRSGVNWGAWRLRNFSTWSQSGSNKGWKGISTYLQRDLKSIKSQIVIGDSHTASEVFDSFAFRGVQGFVE